MPGPTRTSAPPRPDDETAAARPLTVVLGIIVTALCARYLLMLCATVLRP